MSLGQVTAEPRVYSAIAGGTVVTARHALRPDITLWRRIVLDPVKQMGLSGASPHQVVSPRTFHACNVRARVMKTPIQHSGSADLNDEREKENFSMGSGNGGSGSHSRRYRGI